MTHIGIPITQKHPLWTGSFRVGAHRFAEAGDLPGCLLHPLPMGVIGKVSQNNPTGGNFDKEDDIIALIGIVANDAIVMVDTMNIHLRDGILVRQAAARGAADRLRPIISTSITTIVGLIPLALTNVMWRPLCLAVIFGLIASTVLALVIVPSLYMLLTRKSFATVNSLD